MFCPATNELVSVSKDGSVVFWDLLSGERSRRIDVSAVRPGRCTRLYVADSTHLVVDFDTPDSLAHVYDVITGRLLHACALPRLPSPMRGFVAGRILCRQKCLGIYLLVCLLACFFIMPPPPYGGGIKRCFCLTSVCLSHTSNLS